MTFQVNNCCHPINERCTINQYFNATETLPLAIASIVINLWVFFKNREKHLPMV